MLTRVLFASLPALFSLTLFLSAGLLFLVEPMIARMILPLLGGTPAVWNTCMMFFQAVLLAGYGYAHLASRKAGINTQIALHLTLLTAASLVLPVAISAPWRHVAEGSPIGYILLLLLMSVGLPFFVLSGTSLVLQQWFAGTGHPSARDPYFLYSASNLGSMLALVGYPTLIEPYFRLAEQSRAWTGGYILLAACTVFCAFATRKYRTGGLPGGPGSGQPSAVTAMADAADKPLTLSRRGRWVLLAFVPSSLMLGVTTFLSTDVAAIPLFWVIPLALYLLSFIIVFARVENMIRPTMAALLPISLIALIFVNYANLGIPKWIIFIVHLVNFFVTCMVCHGEVAASRPSTKHLTEFYLWISVGGVLGGIFNALIAPLAFNTVLEYPLILAAGALLLPTGEAGKSRSGKRWRTILPYLVVPLVLVALTFWFTTKLPLEGLDLRRLAALLHVDALTLGPVLTYGALGLICYGISFLKKPFLFGMAAAAVLLTIVATEDTGRDIVYRQRSFFGVLTLVREGDGTFMKLYHGVTLHGKQWQSADQRLEPLTYYHRRGPAGQVFEAFSGEQKKSRIAVGGLGAGTLAAYAGPGQEIHFYEIDPAIKMIALIPGYFSYLNACRADWKIILGDARLTLEKAPAHYYDIIVMDAFSSDAIPVHLLTREAIALYFWKLREDGILLLHISNRYVDLAPVLAALAEEDGFAGRICEDDEDDADAEKSSSTWVILAKKEADFGALGTSASWKELERRPSVRPWTDDFSNILAVFQW